MNIDDMEGLDEETRQEIKELQKVTREEYGGNAFGKAYCSIGKILREKNLPTEALIIFNKVKREDSPTWYADAQIEKGLTYYDLNQLEESYQAFDDVKESDGEFHYIMAQYGLGGLLIRDSDKNKALAAWENVKGKGESLSVAKLKFKIGTTLLEDDFSKYDEAR
jgi:tetratricopeptide (TPR) repeat protein